MPSITVQTFREALQAGYRLRADCHTCNRGIEIDLGAMVKTAQADKTFIGRRCLRRQPRHTRQAVPVFAEPQPSALREGFNRCL